MKNRHTHNKKKNGNWNIDNHVVARKKENVNLLAFKVPDMRYEFKIKIVWAVCVWSNLSDCRDVVGSETLNKRIRDRKSTDSKRQEKKELQNAIVKHFTRWQKSKCYHFPFHSFGLLKMNAIRSHRWHQFSVSFRFFSFICSIFFFFLAWIADEYFYSVHWTGAHLPFR